MPNHVTNIIETKDRRIFELLIGDGGEVDFNRVIPIDFPHDPDGIPWLSVKNKDVERVINNFGRKGQDLGFYGTDWKSFLDGLNGEQAYQKVEAAICEKLGIPSIEWGYPPGDKEKAEIVGCFKNICAIGYSNSNAARVGIWGTKWGGYNTSFDMVRGEIRFQSAWSAPHQIVAKLIALFPDASFVFKWADEDIGSNCGWLEVHKGKIVEFKRASFEATAKIAWAIFACEVTQTEIDWREWLEGEFILPEDYIDILKHAGVNPLTWQPTAIKTEGETNVEQRTAECV